MGNGIIGILEEGLRFIVWVLLKFIFFIVDGLYEAIKLIATFNILDENSQVWDYYKWFMAAFLAFFIIFRLTKRYFKTMIDNEEAESFKPVDLILKIAGIGFLVVMAPFILKSFGSLLSNLISSIETVFGVETNKFSHILLNLPDTGIDKSMFDKLGEININQKNADKEFIYLADSTTLLCMFISSIFAGYLMLLMAVQIGTRMLSIVLKLIVAPYSFSSIVDNKNEQFSTWWKLFVADFLSSYLQMLLLIIGTTLVIGINFGGNDTPTFISALAKVLATIGVLMGTINAPSGVAQLIGSDIGASSAIQSLQTTGATLGIAKSAVGAVGGAVLGSAKMAANKGIYGLGRALGGKSIAEQAQTGVGAKITGNGGAFSDSSGNTTIPSNGLDFKENQTQYGGTSDRAGISGWKTAISNMKQDGIVSTAMNIKEAGLPNVAKAVGDVANTATLKDVFSKSSNMTTSQRFKVGAAKVASFGANALYTNASRNIMQGGKKK